MLVLRELLTRIHSTWWLLPSLKLGGFRPPGIIAACHGCISLQTPASAQIWGHTTISSRTYTGPT